MFFSPCTLQSASLWATHVWSTSTHNTSCCYKPDQNPSSKNKDAEEPVSCCVQPKRLSSEQQRIPASAASALASCLHQYLQAKHFPGMKGKIVGNSEQVKSTEGSREKHLILLSNPKHPSQIHRVRGGSSAHFIDGCGSVSVVEGELEKPCFENITPNIVEYLE